MTARDKEWTEHRAYAVFDALKSNVEKAARREGIDAATATDVARVGAVLDTTKKRIEFADVAIAPTTFLDSVATSFDAASAELSTFAADGDITRVRAANTHADAVIALLPQLLGAPVTKKDFAASLDRAREYRRALGALLESAEASAARAARDLANAAKQVTDEKATTLGELESLRTRVSSSLDESKTAFAVGLTELRNAIASESAATKTAFATELDAARASLQAALDPLSARVAELSAELAAEKQRLTGISTDQQNQFAAAQDTRLRDWNESQRDRQEKASALLAEYTQKLQSLSAEQQTQFTAAQDSRNREWNETQTDRQEKVAALIAENGEKLRSLSAELAKVRDSAAHDHEVALDDLRKTFGDQAEAILVDIRAKKVEVEALVGVIGQGGITNGYQRAAKYAMIRSVAWQFLAVAAMGGFIYLAYKSFLPTVTGEFKWPSFAGRVFVSLSVGVLAAYAAAQGDRLAKVEQQNRKLALDLAAFGPFVAPLTEEQQRTFRIALGQRSFGTSPEVSSVESAKSPATMMDLLVGSKEFNQTVLGAAAEVMKKMKPTA